MSETWYKSQPYAGDNIIKKEVREKVGRILIFDKPDKDGKQTEETNGITHQWFPDFNRALAYTSEIIDNRLDYLHKEIQNVQSWKVRIDNLKEEDCGEE